MASVTLNIGYFDENGNYKRKDFVYDTHCPYCKEDIKFKGNAITENVGIVGIIWEEKHYLIHRKCFTPLVLRKTFQNIAEGKPSWSE